jgi:hypothetical protein
MPSGTNQNTSGSANPSDTSAMKSASDSSSAGSGGGKLKRKKRRLDKEKFTSLSVACIKRLLPIGMNTFGGREQELVQLAKHKMIEVGNIVSSNIPFRLEILCSVAFLIP